MELYDIIKTQDTVALYSFEHENTFITLSIINHFAYQPITNFDSLKRSFILVPDASWFDKQAKSLFSRINLKCFVLSEESFEYYDEEQWKEKFISNQVFIMTCLLFSELLSKNLINFSQINLLIINNSHLIFKYKCYKKIAQMFSTTQSEKPRLLAFVPNFFESKHSSHEIDSILKKLENSFGATRNTSLILNLFGKGNDKTQCQIELYHETFFLHKIKSSMAEVIESFFNFIDKCFIEFSNFIPISSTRMKQCIIEVFEIMTFMGCWGAEQLINIYIQECAELSFKISSSNPHLSYLLSAVMTLFYYLNANLKKTSCFQTCQIDSRLKIVSKILKKFCPSSKVENDDANKSSLCGIIFVKKRAIVRLLHIWLQNQIDLGFLKIDYLIGNPAKLNLVSASLSMITKHQKEALSRFKKHEINLLIATTNLESYLDIARCNLVIKYDFPENFVEYFYSKNRVRAENGLYVLLVPIKNDLNPYMEKLKEYYNIELLLRNVDPMQDFFENENNLLYSKNNEEFYYYSTDDPKGPKVGLSNALSILNKYCLKLPSDSLTKLTPQFQFFNHSNGLFQCIINLPVNSPLREPISGEFMPTQTLSMKSAALEACKRLHKKKELNNNFLPYGKESIKDLIELKLYNLENDIQTKRRSELVRIGTVKRRQCFNKRTAMALKGPPPNLTKKCNLYAFILKLTCPIPEEQNTRGRKLFIPSETTRCFALLTCHSVPKICDFPLFIRSGEILVSMKEIAKDLEFNEDELKRISNFHYFVFHNLLRLDKNPMKYDPINAPSSYFILPVNVNTEGEVTEDSLIDWDFMEKVDQYEKRDKNNDRMKNPAEPFVFNKEIYQDAVVIPWYRQYEVQAHYYVADICYDMTPQTSFPDNVHDTFLSYYQQKYNLVLTNLDQPLLDVDHTSARLNLLTSRFVNRKGVTLPISSQKTKKAKRENLQHKQLLIPELCIVHPFPASFWRKAVCIPCILYRVNALLVSEELRQEVAKSTGIGPLTLFSNQNWPPLNFGWTLSQVVAQSYQEKNKSEIDSTFEQSSLDNLNIQTCEQNKISSNSDQNIENNETGLVIDQFDLSLCQNSNCFEFKKKLKFEDCTNSVSDLKLDETTISKTYNFLQSTSNAINKPFENWSFYQNDRIQIKELNDIDNVEFESINIGSPNFEKYDTKKLNTIYDIGIPGLESISAPVILNLQGLSKDLASFKGLNKYESDKEILDETDLDDEAAEFDPHFVSNSKKNNEVKQSKSEDFYNEIIECGLLVQNSHFSSQEKNFLILDEIDISDLDLQIDEKRENDVKFLFEKIFKTNFFEDEQIRINDESEILIAEEDLTINKLIIDLKKKIETNSDETNKNPVKTEVVKKESIQKPSIPFKSNKPNFGELLPNRDEVAIESESINTNLSFDIDDEKLSLGPSPSIILQALTMSNAGDGINLERLETVGDSFLKYAVTVYNYSMCPDMHEGRLSFLRSLQISNQNLYRLGQKKNLGELMVSTKFEPNDNWLPPGFTIPEGSEQALIESTTEKEKILKSTNDYDEEIEEEKDDDEDDDNDDDNDDDDDEDEDDDDDEDDEDDKDDEDDEDDDVDKREEEEENFENKISKKKEKCNLLYSLVTQHSIPDKSIADAVEALIGAYLIYSGPRGALLFMKWLGLKVMPDSLNCDQPQRDKDDKKLWNWLPKVTSSLLFPNKYDELIKLYKSCNFEKFETEIIHYNFKDKSFLIQAFTHNSYYDNKVTECYQRLEFLGDAVLDFLITRHLYDDPHQHSPGVLTDLRSALVNNTFFASLAVKYEFHKFIKVSSLGLNQVISKFVEQFQVDGFDITDKCNLLISEDECEQLEDIEVPKVLGDIFESVAGAIFLDSGLSLDSVWKVYYRMMRPEIEYFSKNIPKSPIRELLELKPQKVLFSVPESISYRKVRVICEVFGEGHYVGIGRNKRLAKNSSAKKALRELKMK